MNVLSIASAATFGVSVYKYKAILSDSSTRLVFLLWYILFLLLILNDFSMKQKISSIQKSCCSQKETTPPEENDKEQTRSSSKEVTQSNWPVYVIVSLVALGIMLFTYKHFFCYTYYFLLRILFFRFIFDVNIELYRTFAGHI